MVESNYHLMAIQKKRGNVENSLMEFGVFMAPVFES